MSTTILLTLFYLLTPVLIIWLFNKYNWVTKVGTVILAYAFGIILALLNTAFGFMPPDGEAGVILTTVQKNLMSVCVPLAIPLMLFNSDFKLWTKSLPKTLAVLLGGVLSVIIALVAGYFIFLNHDLGATSEFKKVAVMMTGIYTGGTLNFAALGEMLHADPNTISITLAFEEIVTLPFIVFILAGGYKLFRKFLPYKDETSIDEDVDQKTVSESTFENYHGMFKGKNFGGMMLGLLLSIAMLGVGVGLSLLIVGLSILIINVILLIVLITGGCGGIGEALCRAFDGAGYNVAFTYLNSGNKARELESALRSASSYRVDLKSEENISDAVDEIIKKYENIDCLINNAGVSLNGLFQDFSKDDYADVFGTNVFGTMLITKKALP